MTIHPLGGAGSRTYALHGYRFRSALPLPGREVAERADLDVTWTTVDRVPAEPPEGAPLAALSLSPEAGFAYAAGEDRLVCRFYRACEFTIFPDRRLVIAEIDRRADAALAALLLAGNVVAFLLERAGHCVLHASAVARGERALAVVGASGMGKSTLAALLCARGASFVTDDLLRVDFDGADVRCVPGPPEVRLRADAGAVVDVLKHAVPARTVDGRTAVRFPEAIDPSRPTLAAIVVPEERGAMAMERCRPREALLMLCRYPRTLGCSSPPLLRGRLRSLVRLVERVPVFRLTAPSGPPFPADYGRTVLSLLDDPSALDNDGGVGVMRA